MQPAVACAFFLVLAALLGCGGGAGEGPEETAAPEAPVRGDGWPVSLYFPAVDGGLGVETRELAHPTPVPGDLAAQAEAGVALAEALLEGPRDESLLVPLGEEVTVSSVDLGEEGTAFLDLAGEPPALGTHGELLVVYSLVNTLALNLEGADAVVLLWNGVQRQTFSGHIDTTLSLKPRVDLAGSVDSE